MNVLIAAVAGLVSGAITSVITYLATVAKTRLDLAVEYDKELRKDRLTVYLKLWPMLKPLAKYSAPKPASYQIVKQTSEKMRDWYFDVGGVYLSQKSRDPYFKLKGEMQTIIDDRAMQEKDGPLPPDKVKALHKGATDLRRALSNDIGTRQGSLLGSRRLRSDRAQSTEPDHAADGAD
jgi:hypothetical protein